MCVCVHVCVCVCVCVCVSVSSLYVDNLYSTCPLSVSIRLVSVGVHVVIMADTPEQRTDMVIMSETYYVCECEYSNSDMLCLETKYGSSDTLH